MWHLVGRSMENDLVKPLITNHDLEKHHLSTNAVLIRQKLNRILQIDQTGVDNATPDTSNPDTMIPKVIVRPNPFFTSITLDVTCSQGKHVIVRMFNDEEKIVKMFSWFLVKGINITNIGEVDLLPHGSYSLDIIDLEGEILYATQLAKEQ
jgi:hypothetical protein